MFCVFRGSIKFRGEGAFLQNARIRAEAHGAAFLRYAALLLHEVDDGMRGLFVELRGVGVCPADYVAGVLDYRALHSEADAEEGDPVFARVFDRRDLALDAARAEPTRYQDAVEEDALGVRR